MEVYFLKLRGTERYIGFSHETSDYYITMDKARALPLFGEKELEYMIQDLADSYFADYSYNPPQFRQLDGEDIDILKFVDEEKEIESNSESNSYNPLDWYFKKLKITSNFGSRPVIVTTGRITKVELYDTQAAKLYWKDDKEVHCEYMVEYRMDTIEIIDERNL